jgi:signal transduction histidine kinase
MGIAADELSQVFERFYRSDAARNTSAGAGLGLSIARWIARTHNAEIKVESERNEGTRFEVRFPVQP